METIRFDFKSFSLTGNNYVVDRNDGTDASGFYYPASDVDALLADVRRLVEAGKYRDNIDNTCRDGWDIFRAKVDLKEAIAAVERHLEEVTSGR